MIININYLTKLLMKIINRTYLNPRFIQTCVIAGDQRLTAGRVITATAKNISPGAILVQFEL